MLPTNLFQVAVGAINKEKIIPKAPHQKTHMLSKKRRGALSCPLVSPNFHTRRMHTIIAFVAVEETRKVTDISFMVLINLLVCRILDLGQLKRLTDDDMHTLISWHKRAPPISKWNNSDHSLLI